MNTDKFILLHVGGNDAKDLLKDALKEGSERGLFVRCDIGKKLIKYFEELSNRGYYPTGMIVNPETENLEFIFNRHPKQSEKMKLSEYQHKDPNEL
jgi:hypothetical protein